eukprot:CAMPEP_0172593114 /NCGR_PEP_ID=MMETSP1068-20121228/12297_1 /TAXON_ID=35684 /ORGANISM="Pseudopedinella elastica, Strain CCMP716" /LENGTH=376 /DNA_ID=CAMNT_0013390501 /DNA_START=9 /DNA_END=1139 /DNA_ORIENTATION=+
MTTAAASSKRMRVEESELLQPLRDTVIVSTVEEAGQAKKIGTHDGKFHCDEALACAMLKFLPEWKDAVIVRTRDAVALEACDIVVDVGGTYDGAKLRFDHHQRGFTHVLDELGFDTKLSSAGLVYKHFGRQVLEEVTKDKATGACPWPPHVTEVVYRKVYEIFMEAIDGIDNGVSVASGDGGGGKPAYRVTTDLSSRVGRLHPSWNEPQSAAVVHERFKEACLLTGGELLECFLGLANGWWPARSVVEKSYDAKSAAVDPSGKVMALDSGGVPWQSHVFDLEAERAVPPEAQLLFVIYEDQSGKWRVQAVPTAEGSFESRLKLGAPEWRGLRDDALSEACGLPGAVFIHAAGFIGGHATREGALALALKTIQLAGR